MAITVSKVTYSLKPETVDRVQELSSAWGVPKSEVIRRAVDQAARTHAISPRLTPLEAIRELRRSATLTPAETAKWEREVRLSRRASGRHRK